MENNTVVYGINEKGIWAQAHAIARQFGCDPEDAYSEIVVQALEATVKNPDIIEKGPAYLLVAAANNTRNAFSQLYHTYMEKKNGEALNLDAMHMAGNNHAELYCEYLIETSYTYDYETAVTVKDIIAGLDDTGKQVAAFLQDGYKAADIARLTGMYPMQVSRVVKNLRTQLAGALL